MVVGDGVGLGVGVGLVEGSYSKYESAPLPALLFMLIVIEPVANELTCISRYNHFVCAGAGMVRSGALLIEMSIEGPIAEVIV